MPRSAYEVHKLAYQPWEIDILIHILTDESMRLRKIKQLAKPRLDPLEMPAEATTLFYHLKSPPLQQDVPLAMYLDASALFINFSPSPYS